MFQIIRYLFIAAVLVAPCRLISSPMIRIGEVADIYATAKTGMRYESNIFRNASSPQDDFIYLFQPGLEFVIGSQSIYGVTLKMYEEMQFFFDNVDLNNNGEHLSLDSFYDSGAITAITLLASYDPIAANTGSENAVASLIRSRNYKLAVNATFDISDKSTIYAGVDSGYKDYRNFKEIFPDSFLISLPVSYMYSVSPIMQVGAGYRFRYTDFKETSNGLKKRDRSDHYFNLRANGEIGPRLYNGTSLGYQIRQINGLGMNTDFSMDSNFTWEASQRVNIKFGASRDFSSTGSGRSTINTRGFFDVAYSITDKMRLDMVTSFSQISYKEMAREDEFSTFGAFWTYVINAYYNVDVGYIYSNNHSTLDGVPVGEQNASFNNHTIQLNASVKY